jgi:hypothetical protein
MSVPLRGARRRFLFWVGVRQGEGRGDSEYFPEDANCQPVDVHDASAF